MLKIQPMSIKAEGSDTYLVRFERLIPADEHAGRYDLANGLVEYPLAYTKENGHRSGPEWPDEFHQDTLAHGDGTGAHWLGYSVGFLDIARSAGIKSEESRELLRPTEISLDVLDENLNQQYVVSFDSNGTKVQRLFTVAGDDDELEISWEHGAYKAKNGLRWTVDDESADISPLIRSIAMLHAARNFIYGPDK